MTNDNNDTNEIILNISGKTRKVRVPVSWDDLPAEKLLAFYDLLFSTPGDEFTASAFTAVKLLSIMQHLLDVDSAFMGNWEAQRIKEDPEHGELGFLHELRQTMHYAIKGLFEIQEHEGVTTYSAKLNLTKNPWPALTGPGKNKRPQKAIKGKNMQQAMRVFYAPADELANLSIYELGMSFSYFEAYLNTNDEAHAHYLLALLYRPSRPITTKERESAWGGDRRQPIRGYEGKVDERVKLVKTLPMLAQRVILFWFAGCRQKIVDSYPKVFKRDSESSRGVNYGWGGVLLSIAEAGPMGNLNEVSDNHYSNALTYLSMKADEVEEAKRQAEQAKRKR